MSAATALLALVAACAGEDTEPPRYTIGGTVVGLAGGAVVVANDGEAITIGDNGRFTFATQVVAGGAYQVTVTSPPSAPLQTCTVEAGSGTVEGDVTDVVVRCSLRILFLGDDGTTGQELHVSDGAAGHLLLDLAPPGSGAGATPAVTLRGISYVGVVGGTSGEVRGVWRTDGTPEGTRRLASVLHRGPVVAGDAVYFVEGFYEGAADSYRLWKSDGSEAGTIVLRDLGPSSRPEELVAVGDMLYFTTEAPGIGRVLWKCDGTAVGTVRVAQNSPHGLTVFGDRLAYIGDDGVHGEELWITDGTHSAMVADIAPGSGSSRITSLTAVGDLLYFGATKFPDEPWSYLYRSDGTDAGTDVIQGPYNFGPGAGGITAIGSTLYFVAWGPFDPAGVWSSDGTIRPATLVHTVSETNVSALRLTVLGSDLYYVTGENGAVNELWRSDGTTAGTERLRVFSGEGAWDLQPLSGAIYFVGSDAATGAELWTTDGTAAGTRQVEDLNPGAGDGARHLL